MSQEHLLILLFRIVLLADVAAVLAFVVIYTLLAPWFRSAIGRTLVIKDLLLVAALMPSVLSLFFHFSRLTSYVAAWIDVVTFGAIAPVMVWRCTVWIRVHRAKRGDEETPAAGNGKETDVN